MRMNRTRIVAAAALLLALAGGGLAFLLVRGAKGEAPVRLSLLHPFNREGEARVLEEVLGEFVSLYPRLPVQARALDPARLQGAGPGGGEAADVLALTGPGPEGARSWAAAPVPWSGTLWVLAARRDVLDRAAGVSEQVQALRAGSLAPAGFEELLQALKAQGVTPLTLGNSHGWPFLIWLQHWAAATAGPEAVDGLPSGDPARDAAWLERLRPAYRTLAGWKAEGLFDPAAWGKGWAEGLAPLASGRAAFALLAAPLLSALPGEARQELEFLPFPGSRGSSAGPWTIGSVYTLGVDRASRHPEEAALLVRYLTSPGVTRVLSRRLGRPFFSWDPQTGLSPRVIPDWYGAANTPPLRVLAKEFGSP